MSFAATAATAARLLCPVGLLGLGTTLHCAPSQCSMRVPPLFVPTAHTSLGLRSAPYTAATPYRKLASIPVLGLDTVPHWLPSHRWTRFWKTPGVRSLPTTHTLLAESATMPLSALSSGLPCAFTVLHWLPSQCISSSSATLHCVTGEVVRSISGRISDPCGV